MHKFTINLRYYNLNNKYLHFILQRKQLNHSIERTQQPKL